MEKKIDLGMSYDRILDLPESLTLRILSFLPIKYAVQTSVLSKNWRMVWTKLRCLRTLDFSYKYLPSSLTEEGPAFHFRDVGMREEFYNFIDQVFGLVMKLEELKLYVPGCGLELMSRVDHWLDRAVTCGVKYLELKIAKSEGIRYSLPVCILGTKSIVKLVLKNCELNLSSFMCTDCTQLPSLRELWFNGVYVNEKVLRTILGICINLESLYLDNCCGLTRLEIDVSDCKNLKKLSLNTVQLDNQDLNSYLKNLPALEHLCLINCQHVKYVEISSDRLVYLEFKSCRDLKKVKIHTPNLKTFHYWGEDAIFLVSKGPAMKLEHADIELRAGSQDEKWYLGLIKLIAKLSHSENFSLNLATIQDAVIPEDVRLKVRPPLHGVKHLTAGIHVSTRHYYDFVSMNVDLVDSLLWLAPCLESLCVSNFDKQILKLFKFKYEKPVKGKKKCGCWKSLAINCWRHSLTNVSLEYEQGDVDDTQLAKFFRNARRDGKMVILSRLPRLKWNMEYAGKPCQGF